MGRLVGAIEARFVPCGWADLIRQTLLWAGAYYAYQLVRWLSEGQASVAYQNARHVISLEHTLGVFVEPGVQAWVTAQHWLIDLTALIYLNAHFILTIVALFYLYVFRNDSFYFVRNTLLIAMGIALVCYAAFPTAPPRALPEWGFTDSVRNYTGISQGSAADTVFVNPLAAIPSMHVAFALLLGWPLARTARRGAARALWYAYPLVMTFVVVATGNHFLTDVVLGALTAAAAVWLAHRLPRRADASAWRLRPDEAEATT